VVAIRQELDGQVTLPDAKTRLANGDVLVVVSAGGAVSRMLEGNPSR
jgi:hypothetical protein